MENRQVFGVMPSGETVYCYTLDSGEAQAKILTLGGILQSLFVFGRDVAAGFDRLEDYLSDNSHQGELVGRTCNRIGDAFFDMDGTTYRLAKNDGGKHHLHGGNIGYGRRIWNVEDYDGESITLSLYSPDGEEGYPGNVYLEVTYRLVNTALSIEYRGKTDRKTPLSLTNHTYFNLLGYGNGDIMGHSLWLDADRYTETDKDLIPTGRRLPVKGTHYDFTVKKTIGENMPLGFFGFDDNFLLNQSLPVLYMGHNLYHGATLSADGVEMEMLTDRPCVQLYIGNYLKGLPHMKGGQPKVPHTTVCLETQTEPNSIKRGENFLLPDETYFAMTVFRFRQNKS